MKATAGRISVCLASHNGERFVDHQIRSILGNLEGDDELIIVDDCSTDGTVGRISRIADPRIRLVRSSVIRGHVRTFESCLALAEGEIIFLSDQDDIWHPRKREIVLAEFDRCEKVVMVHHALRSIDADGADMGRTIGLACRQVGSGLRLILRELVQPTIMGCSVAFRRGLLSTLMPFPESVYAHDHWISLVAALRGDVVSIPETLVRYRYHGSNLTPKGGLSMRGKIRSRLALLNQIYVASCRIGTRGRRPS